MLCELARCLAHPLMSTNPFFADVRGMHTIQRGFGSGCGRTMTATPSRTNACDEEYMAVVFVQVDTRKPTC